MSQEVLSKEDVEHLRRFHQLNNQIVAGYKKAVSGYVSVLKAFWEITKHELWKLEYDEITDWLRYLRDRGVMYAARSTFYEKIELIKKFACIVDEDEAIRLAAEHHGTLRLLESSKAFTFTQDGRGTQAVYKLVDINREIVGDDPRAYVLSLTRMRRRQALARVKLDAGKAEVFIEPDWIPDYFYRQLIDEINRVYKNQLPMSLAVLIRKLLENLVIDILRAKYGKSNTALYYDTPRRRFHDFSMLVRNLRARKTDFAHITASFDKVMTDVDEFRETGNAGAHSLDVNLTTEDLAKERKRINNVVNALLRMLKNA